MQPKGASTTANQGQLTALMSAALDGDTNKVRTLLESGADINAQDAKGRTALMLAVINRHASTAKVLLNAGADMSVRADDGRTALSLAALTGDGAIMRVLMSHRPEAIAESNPTGARVMRVAAKIGYTSIVRLLQKVSAKRSLT